LFAPTGRKSMAIINVTIKALTIKVTVILRTPNSQNIYGPVWIAALQAAWVPGTPNWMHGSEDGARQAPGKAVWGTTNRPHTAGMQ